MPELLPVTVNNCFFLEVLRAILEKDRNNNCKPENLPQRKLNHSGASEGREENTVCFFTHHGIYQIY